MKNWSAPDPGKFPKGIAGLSAQVRDAGMKFGLWFDSQWAHVDSELYREHPSGSGLRLRLPGAGMPHDPSSSF